MEPISDLLRAVLRDDPLTSGVLAALVARIDEAAPPLRELLAKAARGRPLSDDDATLLFYGLHVLGAGRDRQSFAPLLQLLRRPTEEVEDLLGDGFGESLPRIAAGLFDDDADALLVAAVDPRIDEFARNGLLCAAAFLTFDGRIALQRMHDFLDRFEDETPPPDGDFGWAGWVQAVTHLGLRDLLPRVERVFAADRLPERLMEWRHVEQDLRDAERAPFDSERFTSAGLGYADDLDETLRWTECFDSAPEQPIVNPHRNVGRNDPCPCGSGKKYKKCCLAQQ